MNILGIHALSHDAGACLISEGKISAVSEERLTRKKYDEGFPKRAISYVLKASGVSKIKEIDLVVFDSIGSLECEKKIHKIIDNLGFCGETACISHHDAHAASAFFSSPYDSAAVLVIDGFGSSSISSSTQGHYLRYLNAQVNSLREAQSIYIGHGNQILPIRRTYLTPQFCFGIGMLYALSSAFLGFGYMGSGKLMALAAYGRGKRFRKAHFLRKMEGEILAEGYLQRDPAESTNLKLYGKEIFQYPYPRERSDPIKKIHAEIAAWVQKETEEAVLYLVKNLFEITRLRCLCYAGGVALNCITNTRILRESDFSHLFIQPAASDTGIPLGCALYGYHMIRKQPRKFKMKSIFFGRPYTEQEISYALSKVSNIKFSKPRELHKVVARHISEGKIVGWHKGGSELGPRALGHRSILADPRRKSIKERMNRYVKKREWFRPYAASVLAEHASDYFDFKSKSPFMLLSPKVRNSKKKSIPAVVHVDGTARIQTVGKREVSAFFKLIQKFYTLSGVPMLLNTSFNSAGEPIVETPKDALNCFLKTDIDLLVIGNFLVRKSI